MLSQVAVDTEGNLAVCALKRSRVGRGGRAERGVDVDFVEVSHRALVLLQVALCAEGDGAGVATERTLEVVNVHVKTQLR